MNKNDNLLTTDHLDDAIRKGRGLFILQVCIVLTVFIFIEVIVLNINWCN
jgi:hypothetical protein